MGLWEIMMHIIYASLVGKRLKVGSSVAEKCVSMGQPLNLQKQNTDYVTDMSQ